MRGGVKIWGLAGSSQNVYEGRSSIGEEIGISCKGMGKHSTSVYQPILGITLFLSMTPNNVNVSDRSAPPPQFLCQALGMGFSVLKVTTVENRADISIAVALFGSSEC